MYENGTVGSDTGWNGIERTGCMRDKSGWDWVAAYHWGPEDNAP